jgi:penicillin-binding protein 1A
MRDAEMITDEEETRARAELVTFAEPKVPMGTDSAGYVIDFALDRMVSLIGESSAEIVIETTFDAALQRRASAIVAKELDRQGIALAASQAAIAVLDAEGGIRALVGGRSYGASQFNRAVKARRQPGSAFKPFVYLAALESGLTPDSIAFDLPVNIGGWTPHNDNGRYVGAVSLRQALARSINTVAVRLLMDVGSRRVITTARRLGIKSELRNEATLALGASEVSLLELTGAYDAFANGGHAVEPYAIRRIRLASGRVLYERRAQKPAQTIEPVHVGAMNDMLNAALTSGTGQRAGLPLHPAAGKTGTSQDFRDAWFVGYTAQLTAGVWVGNDDGHAMNKVKGGNLPAEIWRRVMLTAHEGKTPLALPGTASPLAESLAPMVRRSSEILPWAARREPTPSPSAGPRVANGARTFPKERIGADFIARALDGGATGTAPGRAGQGMMALGNRPE